MSAPFGTLAPSTLGLDVGLSRTVLAAVSSTEPPVVLQNDELPRDERRTPLDERHARALAAAGPARDVVLVAPAEDDGRAAAIDAATRAGWTLTTVIEHPLAVVHGLSDRPVGRYLVVDAGARSCRAAVVTVDAAGAVSLRSFERATEAGGDAFDVALFAALTDAFAKVHNRDLSRDPAAARRVLGAAETAKRVLDTAEHHKVVVGDVATDDAGRSLELKVLLSREVAWARAGGVRDGITDVCRRALAAAGDPPGAVRVVLVGGMATCPLVPEAVARAVAGQNVVPADDPAALAACGAARFGRARQGDRTTSPYGTAGAQGGAGPSLKQTHIGRVATRRMFAQGNAGATEALVDRLAVGTMGGYCEDILAKDAPVPAERVRVFTTSRDDQESVSVDVCQGDSRRLEENRGLGRLLLAGLPKLARGKVRIAVRFAVDDQGVLVASARDEATGRETRLELLLTKRETV